MPHGGSRGGHFGPAESQGGGFHVRHEAPSRHDRARQGAIRHGARVEGGAEAFRYPGGEDWVGERGEEEEGARGGGGA